MKKHVSTLPHFEGKVPAASPVFLNWVTVEKDVLSRSSAPNYVERKNDADKTQNMNEAAVNFLKTRGIEAVVSLNYYILSVQEIDRLKKQGIKYFHLKVKDFGTPDINEVLKTIDDIQGDHTLVYCGFGQGRTGTFVSAWQIYHKKMAFTQIMEESTAETDEQGKFLMGMGHLVK